MLLGSAHNSTFPERQIAWMKKSDARGTRISKTMWLLPFFGHQVEEDKP